MSYELHREIIVAGGSASAQHNNISSYYHDGRQLSYAAIAHNQQVTHHVWPILDRPQVAHMQPIVTCNPVTPVYWHR
jgi:hypothetical protein